MALMAVSVSLYSQKPKPLGLPVSRSNTNLQVAPGAQPTTPSQSVTRAYVGLCWAKKKHCGHNREKERQVPEAGDRSHARKDLCELLLRRIVRDIAHCKSTFTPQDKSTSGLLCLPN